MSEPGNAQTENDRTAQTLTGRGAELGNEEQSAEDAQAGFLGFLILATILYFAVVFGRLPEGGARWVITGVLAATVAAISIAAKKWDWVQTKLPTVQRHGIAAYDFLIFVLVVAAVVFAAVSLAAEDKVVLLKVFAVVYFSLLPPLLYLQFSSQRTLAVWRDYVCNLYKLQADDPASLPRPPTLSRFHRDWVKARDRAWTDGLVKPLTPDETRAEVDRKLEWSNQYQLKFRDLFGEIPLFEQPLSVLSIRSAHKLQVVMATALMTLGWTFVVYPETLFDRSFTPAGFKLANLPAVPRETFAFAFLGAYFYILQMLVRRYFQNDLKATAYINATMRIVIVILIVWVIDPLLADTTSQATRSALAFVIGVFPTVGWQVLQQFLIRKPIGLVVDSLEPKHKLGDLDGLNIWYESRLLEVGIEDMQNLATTDIVDLMLNTRIPVDRIVDWIDQAFLYLRVVDEPSRELLRRYGIRTATDLEDALGDAAAAESLARLLNYVRATDEKGKDAGLAYSDGAPVDDGLPSRLLAIRATIQRERNMQHVRAWKEYVVEATEATTRPDASREAPATATPSEARG
jgi:hypothetical protein